MLMVQIEQYFGKIIGLAIGTVIPKAPHEMQERLNYTVGLKVMFQGGLREIIEIQQIAPNHFLIMLEVEGLSIGWKQVINQPVIVTHDTK
jgi:hypothetical protein